MERSVGQKVASRKCRAGKRRSWSREKLQQQFQLQLVERQQPFAIVVFVWLRCSSQAIQQHFKGTYHAEKAREGKKQKQLT